MFNFDPLWWIPFLSGAFFGMVGLLAYVLIMTKVENSRTLKMWLSCRKIKKQEENKKPIDPQKEVPTPIVNPSTLEEAIIQGEKIAINNRLEEEKRKLERKSNVETHLYEFMHVRLLKLIKDTIAEGRGKVGISFTPEARIYYLDDWVSAEQMAEYINKQTIYPRLWAEVKHVPEVVRNGVLETQSYDLCIVRWDERVTKKKKRVSRKKVGG